tara:strand:- start:292 stop:726 length:435 start_codon:yes stop_codon:yes gene_type:complete
MEFEILQKLKKLEKENRTIIRKLNKLNNRFGDDTHVCSFSKPTKMSKELCKFLKVSEDTMYSRTDVTKCINQYINQNSLHGKDKREIVLDSNLRTIIDIPEDVVLTYFNLQKYLAPHYIKEINSINSQIQNEGVLKRKPKIVVK